MPKKSPESKPSARTAAPRVVARSKASAPSSHVNESSPRKAATPKELPAVAPSLLIHSPVKLEPLQILRPDGSLNPKVKAPEIAPADLKRLFSVMIANREIDERMLTLQRQGRIGFYMQSRGEEASVLGPAFASTQEDWLFLCYRELASLLWRGFDLKTFCHQLFGTAQDWVKGRQMPCHYTARNISLVSISSPVSTQIPQAAGVGWGMRLEGDGKVTLCFMGEGGTSEGDFHCGMNFAAVYRASTVFICRNNRWAISTPAHVQSASATFAEKAFAYGMPAALVDGSDLLAMIAVSREAVKRARAGQGATLIEALTYRLSAHSSSDDPSVYRNEKTLLNDYGDFDPLTRFRAYLKRLNLWSREWEAQLVQSTQETLMAAIQEAEAAPIPDTSTMFDDVYEHLPWHLKEQREEALRHPQKPLHGGAR